MNIFILLLYYFSKTIFGNTFFNQKIVSINISFHARLIYSQNSALSHKKCALQYNFEIWEHNLALSNIQKEK